MSGKYFVLSGQHRVEAARQVAADAERAARPVPSWTQTFRCRVVKADTSLAQRQLVAGRIQARDSTVLDMTTAERITWLVKELAADRQRFDAAQEQREADGKPREQYIPNKQACLRETYYKTGCQEKRDGTVVCHPSPSPCCALECPMLV